MVPCVELALVSFRWRIVASQRSACRRDVMRYNNADGFTIQFTLVDYGEPGDQDRMSIRIFETANPANVVLDVPLTILQGGNLQAHYDQPHK